MWPPVDIARRLATVAGQVDAQADVFEQDLADFAVDRLVLDQQDPPADMALPKLGFGVLAAG